jgi:hypothetical protein
MTQQFGPGWETRMQAISQKLGMYGGGQPEVAAPPGAPPGTTPREQPIPPITGANTTQGEGGWPQTDWTTPATSIASAIDLARAAPGQLKAAVQERMTQPWSELGRRVETNAASLLETLTRGRGGEPGPTGGTMGPTAVRSIYNKFATPPEGQRSIWEMEGTPSPFTPNETGLGRLAPLNIPGMPANVGDFTAQRVAGALARKKQLEEMGRLRPLPISYAPESRRRPSLSQGSGYRNW